MSTEKVSVQVHPPEGWLGDQIQTVHPRLHPCSRRHWCLHQGSIKQSNTFFFHNCFREAVQYYFADFVRKGLTSPFSPLFTDKIVAEKRVVDFGEYPHSSNQVMRCEHDTETLGLTVLDEPAALQSDPTILDLQVSFVLFIWLVDFWLRRFSTLR